MRQSLAGSTAARVSWPGYCSSLLSSRSNRVKASAVAPAKPPITSPLPSRRTFLALALMTVWPIETWPSPPITTLPPLRTVRMVVPCQTGSSFCDICMQFPRIGRHLGAGGRGYNCRIPLTMSRTTTPPWPSRSGEGPAGLLKGPRFARKDKESLKFHAHGHHQAQDQGDRYRGDRQPRWVRCILDFDRYRLLRPYAGPSGPPLPYRHDGEGGRRPAYRPPPHHGRCRDCARSGCETGARQHGRDHPLCLGPY